MDKAASGYEEREHSADVALFVWSDSLNELYIQAGKGLGDLIKPEYTNTSEQVLTSITCEAIDAESLLVAFLSELLYYLEEKNILYVPFAVWIEQNQMDANLKGHLIEKQGREIKAVTYSDLRIKQTKTGFETTIVFDT